MAAQPAALESDTEPPPGQLPRRRRRRPGRYDRTWDNASKLNKTDASLEQEKNESDKDEIVSDSHLAPSVLDNLIGQHKDDHNTQGDNRHDDTSVPRAVYDALVCASDADQERLRELQANHVMLQTHYDELHQIVVHVNEMLQRDMGIDPSVQALLSEEIKGPLGQLGPLGALASMLARNREHQRRAKNDGGDSVVGRAALYADVEAEVLAEAHEAFRTIAPMLAEVADGGQGGNAMPRLSEWFRSDKDDMDMDAAVNAVAGPQRTAQLGHGAEAVHSRGGAARRRAGQARRNVEGMVVGDEGLELDVERGCDVEGISEEDDEEEEEVVVDEEEGDVDEDGHRVKDEGDDKDDEDEDKDEGKDDEHLDDHYDHNYGTRLSVEDRRYKETAQQTLRVAVAPKEKHDAAQKELAEHHAFLAALSDPHVVDTLWEEGHEALDQEAVVGGALSVLRHILRRIFFLFCRPWHAYVLVGRWLRAVVVVTLWTCWDWGHTLQTDMIFMWTRLRSPERPPHPLGGDGNGAQSRRVSPPPCPSNELAEVVVLTVVSAVVGFIVVAALGAVSATMLERRMWLDANANMPQRIVSAYLERYDAVSDNYNAIPLGVSSSAAVTATPVRSPFHACVCVATGVDFQLVTDRLVDGTDYYWDLGRDVLQRASLWW